MLRWRLPLGILLIAAVIGLGWLDLQTTIPGIVWLPIALGVALAATGELLWLLEGSPARPIPWVVYSGNAAIVLACWFHAVTYFPPAGAGFSAALTAYLGLNFFAGPMCALGLAILLAFLGEIARYTKPGGITQRLAMTTFAFCYVGVLLAFVVELRLRFIGSLGLVALTSLFLVVKLSDIGAYTVGRLIGRHKMAPVLSPGKTMEGAAGALVFACLGGWLALRVVFPLVDRPAAEWFAASWTQCISLGLLVGLAGIFGDLAESLLKRDLGRKDSSAWLPGFGGVLDIVDSILLAAPVAYLWWAFEIGSKLNG